MAMKDLTQPLDVLEARELQVDNKEIIAWIQKVRSACVNISSSQSIISDISEIIDKHDIDRHDEKLPYYNFLLAYARGFFSDTEGAIIVAELSASGFKKLGKDWQQATSNWLHGILLFKQGQFERAKAKIDDAIKIISELAKEQYRLGFYDKHKELQYLIGVIEADGNRVEGLKASIPKQDATPLLSKNKSEHVSGINKKQKPRKKLQPRPPRKSQTSLSYRNRQASGYIAIPWLPIFQSVSAGPNGIVIMDAPSNAEVTLNVIDIYDVPHNIYPVKKMDRQVTLNHIFTYGLVKVEGNSMNNAQPVHINDGDYVLFSKQQSSEENDIVIASHKIPGGDFAYMVKRYLKRDKLLVSESSENYPVIEISHDHQILGVVIAVAKAKK